MLNKFEKQAMWEIYNKQCFYCKEVLQFKNMQLEHIIPQNNFTKNNQLTRKRYKLPDNFDFNYLDNLVPSCQNCNLKKSKKEFYAGIPLWLDEAKKNKKAIQNKVKKLEKNLILICHTMK